MEQKNYTKMEALEAIKIIRGFMPGNELKVLVDNMRKEEKQFFFNKAVEIADTIKNMPVTYEQDGKGKNAVAYLHYFRGDADWYITEKDKEAEQIQAFGLADLGYGGELGYISIDELVGAGVELDLYFTPKTLGEIQENN